MGPCFFVLYGFNEEADDGLAERHASDTAPDAEQDIQASQNGLPDSSSPSDSSENAEKVVNPPHTPVFQNRRAASESPGPLSARPVTTPIRTAPAILVSNVRTGKSRWTGIRPIR